MNRKKIVLIRLDKIGDLVCTLPVDLVLDPSVYDVTWVVQKGLGQLIDLGEAKRQYVEFDKADPQAPLKLAAFLQQNKFDIAISFQCPWWVNFELFKARVKRRIGVLSQWHSFLFLNQGVRQKRSKALKHEFEYNLDLVQKVIGPIHRNPDDLLMEFKKPSSSEVLEQNGLSSGNYIVLHPGMTGSSLNCSQEKYIEYIWRLINAGEQVVITGTEGDNPYLYKIKEEFVGDNDSAVYKAEHKKVKWLQSKLNFKELIQVLYYAKMVVVPATGVAHISAALGQKIRTIYPPVVVQHPRRWRPRGRHVEVLMPEDTPDCPGKKYCLGHKCLYYNCMERIPL